jgi:transcription elongation factor S-II
MKITKENATKNNMQGFFMCPKCESRLTDCKQLQTRGADEPMTNFLTCLKCDNQWKEE